MMPEEAIQLFFANINPNVNCDSMISDETEIYTRDGWKY